MNDVRALGLPGTCDVHIPGCSGSAACHPIPQQRRGGEPSGTSAVCWQNPKDSVQPPDDVTDVHGGAAPGGGCREEDLSRTMLDVGEYPKCGQLGIR